MECTRTPWLIRCAVAVQTECEVLGCATFERRFDEEFLLFDRQLPGLGCRGHLISATISCLGLEHLIGDCAIEGERRRDRTACSFCLSGAETNHVI